MSLAPIRPLGSAQYFRRKDHRWRGQGVTRALSWQSFRLSRQQEPQSHPNSGCCKELKRAAQGFDHPRLAIRPEGGQRLSSAVLGAIEEAVDPPLPAGKLGIGS